MNPTTTYPTIISIDHESNPRLYDTSSYNTYSPYSDYPTTSKLEAFDYNYWPSTTTHNLLTTNSTHDQIPTSPITNEIPSSVHLSRTAISSTHHHHHIHQHLYPPSGSSNESSNWLTSTEYQTPNSYRHYPYPNNTFYDQSQWSTPTTTATTLPIKFEPPYTPPSYFDSSNNLDQPLSDSKEEPSDSSYTKCQDQQINWFKPQLNPVPPKNPMNGM